ncbi:MAG: rhodanese-like domain-containing protein [Sumerlaeia bacterium]
MALILFRILLILVLAGSIAGIDGLLRGLDMPKQTDKKDLSDLTRRAPAPTPDDAPAPSEPHGGSAPEDEPAEPPAASNPVPEAQPDDGLGMTAQELSQAMAEGLVDVVDSRRRDQYVEGHIPNAFLIPAGELLAGGRPPALDILPKDRTIVVYCEGGDCEASHDVASLMLELGFQDVRIFERGFPAWEAAGLPVNQGEPLF